MRKTLWSSQGGTPQVRSVAVVVGIALVVGQAFAQQDAPSAASGRADNPPLTVRTRIPLPGVYGRIDHYGWDSKRGLLIVSALGNNTVEIVDQWRRAHTIEGLEHPQASVYVPGIDRIAVSSQSGIPLERKNEGRRGSRLRDAVACPVISIRRSCAEHTERGQAVCVIVN